MAISRMRRVDPSFERMLAQLKLDFKKLGIDLNDPQATKVVAQRLNLDLMNSKKVIKKIGRNKKRVTLSFDF